MNVYDWETRDGRVVDLRTISFHHALNLKAWMERRVVHPRNYQYQLVCYRASQARWYHRRTLRLGNWLYKITHPPARNEWKGE